MIPLDHTLRFKTWGNQTDGHDWHVDEYVREDIFTVKKGYEKNKKDPYAGGQYYFRLNKAKNAKTGDTGMFRMEY